jgi:hypothetical protein
MVASSNRNVDEMQQVDDMTTNQLIHVRLVSLSPVRPAGYSRTTGFISLTRPCYCP